MVDKIFKKDEWLTNILEYDVYNIDYDSIKHYKKELVLPYSALYCIKIPNNDVITTITLINSGFEYICNNIVFELEEYSTVQKNNIEINICPYSAEMQTDVLRIAGKSFSFSRFHKDRRIPECKANKIYQEWVKSHIEGNRGDGLWVAEKNEIPIGFLATMSTENYASIDLICVNSDYQKLGVASSLVNFFIEAVYGKKIRVETQSSNIPAIKLYEKYHFKIKEVFDIFHFHKRYKYEK